MFNLYHIRVPTYHCLMMSDGDLLRIMVLKAFRSHSFKRMRNGFETDCETDCETD